MRSQYRDFKSSGNRLVVALLFFTAFSIISTDCIAQKFVASDYDAFIRKGCKFTMGPSGSDAMAVSDPLTGNEQIYYRTGNPAPVAIGRKKVYAAKDVTTPPESYPGQTPLEDYLLTNLKEEFLSWQKGIDPFRIDLFNVIVDEKGRVVYYEYRKVNGYQDGVKRSMDAGTLDTKINKLMSDAPAIKPATVSGENVAAYSNLFLFDYTISVKDGKATYSKNSLHPGQQVH